MRTKPLGQTGLSVPAIMLGGNVFGWTLNEADSFLILDAAFDAGLNFIDTADIYSTWVPGNKGGESETIIGKWFARSGKRNQVTIATKVGMDMGGGKKGLAAKYMEQEVEDSLRRLQTDHIDLYQSHEDDASVPLEETMGAFDAMVKKGKVRFIGASNFSGARLREAMETAKRASLASYQTLQPHYNMMDRSGYESDLAPVVAEYNLAVIPYFSLASGFLTGKYRGAADLNKSPRGGGMSKYLNDRGHRVLDALDAAAKEYNSSQASVALAWLLAQPNIAAPISSATKVEHIKDLVAASELKLGPESVQKLNVASAN
ncbi:MAG TPA: aldo/keto reductase [Bryobacteraceae bacterium]|jgi:aryl-alcohol dehydrogenase-like predicted oxidoreductase